jgi:hypothetical protein
VRQFVGEKLRRAAGIIGGEKAAHAAIAQSLNRGRGAGNGGIAAPHHAVEVEYKRAKRRKIDHARHFTLRLRLKVWKRSSTNHFRALRSHFLSSTNKKFVTRLEFSQEITANSFTESAN